MGLSIKYKGSKVAAKQKYFMDVPEITSAYAVYPYSKSIEKKFSFVSRFQDPYVIYTTKGRGKNKKIIVPRNACPMGLKDMRTDGLPVDFDCNFKARDSEQTRVVKESSALLAKEESFIIEAPTRSGKTVMSMSLIAFVGRKTAIVVTKETIKLQWVKAVKEFLGLKNRDIGIVQGSKCQVKNKKLVIFMIQSVSKKNKYQEGMFKDFGLVIWDEVHRMGSDHFSNSAWLFTAKLRLGLSATPYRKDGKDKVFKMHIGPVKVVSVVMKLTPTIYTHKSPWSCPQTRIKTKTGYEIGPIPHSAGRTMHINKLLGNHRERNLMIARFVYRAWEKKRQIIVFSDIKIHLENIKACCLHYGVPESAMVMFVSGLSAKQIDAAKLKPIMLATYGYASEGTDIPWLDTLVLATPHSDVKQIIGRVLTEYEDKKDPIVYDVLDGGSAVFDSYANTRMKLYKKMGAEIIKVKMG